MQNIQVGDTVEYTVTAEVIQVSPMTIRVRAENGDVIALVRDDSIKVVERA